MVAETLVLGSFFALFTAAGLVCNLVVLCSPRRLRREADSDSDSYAEAPSSSASEASALSFGFSKPLFESPRAADTSGDSLFADHYFASKRE